MYSTLYRALTIKQPYQDTHWLSTADGVRKGNMLGSPSNIVEVRLQKCQLRKGQVSLGRCPHPPECREPVAPL